MKTKTGKLLMMQVKAKSNQLILTQPEPNKIFSAQQITHVKMNNLSELPQDDVKNKQGHQQISRNLHEEQLTKLRQQNDRLYRQIQTLKLQLERSYANYKALQKQSHKLLQTPKKTENTQQDINSNKKPQELKPLSKTQSKLQQKCSALQVQNYRLIETNYLLLLNLKKNLKHYKDCLVRIVKKIQGLEFTQASKQIYDILSGLKYDEQHNEGLQRKFFPHKHKEQSKQQDKATTLLTKLKKNKVLTLNSNIYNLQHFIENIQKRQNSIQIKVKKLPQIQSAQPIHQPRQSSSFNLINTRYPDPDFFPHSNKLFNSQIHQNQNEMSRLDQVSLHDKIENEWEHGVKKQPMVYKCYGNSIELYKMLMLQAMAIEGFF